MLWRTLPQWLTMAAALLLLGARQPSAPATIKAAAPLGQVTTATVTLDNTGRPEGAAFLYEAWDAPETTGPLPLAATQPLRVPLPDTPGPIAPQLMRELASSPDGRAEMLIYLADQVDLSAAGAIPDWKRRGEAVVRTLEDHAVRTQAPLLAALREAGYDTPRSFWIVNAILTYGDLALAESLAARPEVGLVTANEQHLLERPLAASPASTSAGQAAWGVARIGAPGVWADWNVRGQGIVVANIDTGVEYSHTALLPAYRGWSPQGLTHAYNWYDPAQEPSPEPNDSQGHGTHTMGIMAGRAADEVPAIGVAPGTRWIAARGCAGYFCSDADLITSAQWMLAPTDLSGDNPRPDLRPHIINNSWGDNGDSPWYVGYVAAWNAAGIFSVFANGNGGTLFGCGSSNQPGNYTLAFSAGATDGEDYIADFSSRGPTSDNRIKPDVSAPGVDVLSAGPNGGVILQSGTSMAAPHVAGTVALLWSANPLLIGDLPATRYVLTSTAAPRLADECDSSGVPNNAYGWGRIDAHRAVQTARVDVPWLSLPASISLPADALQTITVTFDARQVSAPDEYTARVLVVRDNVITPVAVTFDVQPAIHVAQATGRLLDRWSGRGIYGRLQFAEGPPVAADPDTGSYTVTLPYGTYPATATALGYVPDSTVIALNGDTPRDITLTANLPHLRLATLPVLSATLPFGGRLDAPVSIGNDGPQPLAWTVSVPPLEWSVETVASGAPLYDLSAFPPLPLADDTIYTNTLDLGFPVPIYGALVDRLYLSSNGWVSMARPNGAAPLSYCFPSDRVPAGALAPFWTDLDPSVGGAVRAGRVLSDTYVVSWEAVPPWQEDPAPNPPTYTFQLVLHADGRVQFIYGAMGDLPGRWGVGVSYDLTRAQNLACHRNPQPLTARTWTLRNQPSPALWLSGMLVTQTVMPGETAVLTASLAGLGYVPWRTEPFTGQLRLTTNDPTQAAVDIPAGLSVGAPPYVFWFPVIGK